MSPRAYSLRFLAHFPLVADGDTARFATGPPPDELGTHFGVGGIAIFVALVRLGLVLRGGRPTELVDSLMPSFSEALLGSFNGMFRGRWRPSFYWGGLEGRSAGIVLLTGRIPAHRV